MTTNILRALPPVFGFAGGAILLVVSATASAVISATVVVTVPAFDGGVDWWTFEEAANRLLTGDLYRLSASPYGPDEPYAFRYSPLFAVAMVPITTLGLDLWRLVHIAALALLPWRMAIITLIFPAFWYDVLHANVMTFVFVSAFFAIRGSRWGTMAYFTLMLLVPRPLMLPLAAWIVWKRPQWRLPAAGFAGVGLLMLLWPGFLESITVVRDFLIEHGMWPSRLLGWWWVPIGIALAVWLTRHGKVGLASVAINPYILQYYLLMALLDLTKSPRQEAVDMSTVTLTERQAVQVDERHGRQGA